MDVVNTAGFEIFLGSMPVTQGHAWLSKSAAGYWFGSLLDGNVDIDSAIGPRGRWSKNSSAWFCSRDAYETNHVALDDGALTAVFIRVPLDEIERIVGPDGMTLLDERAQEVTPLCPRVTAALAWQMLGCPLSGPIRRLYLSGKALEIVAHALDAGSHMGQGAPLAVSDVTPDHTRFWSSRDIEVFHEARSILIAELDDPPTVDQLARRVGMNPRKLGRGFLDVFGSSLYAFVKACRLDRARELLESGDSSVATAAYSVGYTPSHLSTEFRKRFGISPTALIPPRGKSRTSPN